MMSERIRCRYTFRLIVQYGNIYVDKTNMPLSSYQLCDSLMHVYLYPQNVILPYVGNT